ncbi:UvrD-helicase domain-containing protein [Salinibacterium sp. ZJ454]|uniref:UvrD-helicase domain-containing protein n=1 Tax=Salinibacterium sp. ZJ454 TaxID=2708339 RepID=UPI00141F1F60|nr:UvrD-helicase domain-containing protein [Salinibacterium sp. ZJ454]
MSLLVDDGVVEHRPTLADQADRDAITNHLDRQLFVEAGAGSGKTHQMVSRIIQLVSAGEPISAIAAITFTEKAAAELRQRIRTTLSESNPSIDEPLRQRALDELDTAPIGTIHSFAARILTENPIEAGMPPVIDVIDELRSGIAFGRRWERARAELFADPGSARALEVLLGLGVSLGQLEKLARSLDQSWDRLDGLDLGVVTVPALDPLPLLAELGEQLARRAHCSNPADSLLPALDRLEQWHRDLSEAARNDDEPAALALLADSTAFKNIHLGAKGNWSDDLAEIKATLKKLKADAPALLAGMITPALNGVTATLARVLLDEARERQRSGTLEFHDLLVHTRDLLVGEEHARVHRRIHDRYPRLMLDEFQDTDPIQAEIAVRIAASNSTGRDEWRQLRVPAGRLFMVGDPKQSIYRFRRADIATYLELQELSREADPTSVVSLTTNFRSTAPVLDWVNRVFGELVQADGHAQPAYAALAPAPDRPTWATDLGPAVSVLGTSADDLAFCEGAKAAVVREREAHDIASIILEAIGEGPSLAKAWQKEAPGKHGFVRTPVELKDVCILIPSRTSLTSIETALDAAGIEFVAEASSLVYSTQEVHDLLLALRALANTADEAALALTLRTPLFGIGDDELLTWKAGLGRWGLYSPVPEGLKQHSVAEAIAYLKQLHRDLPTQSPADLLTRLVADRRVLEMVTDSPRSRDVWRRVRFVIDQAQAWSDATSGSLREYLDWADAQRAENARVKEAVVPETGTDAVRITTVHASKGREFPVVVVAGSATGISTDSPAVLWGADGTPLVHLVSGVEHDEYAAAKKLESSFDMAERQRLLYVACTRAESHLIVSLYRASKSWSYGKELRGAHETSGAEFVVEQPNLLHGHRRTHTADPLQLGPLPEWRDWVDERAAWEEASTRPASVSVTALAKGSSDVATLPMSTTAWVDPTPSGDPSQPFIPIEAQLHGTVVGTAVHRVLELSDLKNDDRLPDIAVEVAREFGLAGTSALEAMARSALLAEPVVRASTREHWLELPIAASSGGVVLEGVADLVYREDDKSLVVVDFKTDLGVSEASETAYWRQLDAYAEMLKNAAGEFVSRLALVYCRESEPRVRLRDSAVSR